MIYEEKVVSELIQKMFEAKEFHELNNLYNEAERILFATYATLFDRINLKSYFKEKVEE